MVTLKCPICNYKVEFIPEEGKEIPKCPNDGSEMKLDTDIPASELSYGTSTYIRKTGK